MSIDIYDANSVQWYTRFGFENLLSTSVDDGSEIMKNLWN